MEDHLQTKGYHAQGMKGLTEAIVRASQFAAWLLFATFAVPRSALAADGGSPDASANTQATYYVSPQGSDCNLGTLAAPFRTLGKARDVVRTVNGAMTGDIVVYLRGGTYPLTSTLALAAVDSGSKGFYVKYLNYPGETPLLTGGQPIGGWTVCSHRDVPTLADSHRHHDEQTR